MKNRLTPRCAPIVVGLTLAVVAGPVTATSALAADDTKAKQGAQQVESGAKQIGEGVQDTAKGVGQTVVGGAEMAGDKIQEAGRAAEPEAKSAWTKTKEGAVAFGESVKNFFTTLFD